MKNSDMPAMPTVYGDMAENGEREIFCDQLGLTKREMFAMHAMQGMLASNFASDFASEINDESYDMPNGLANNAVRYADALLAQLEESGDE